MSSHGRFCTPTRSNVEPGGFLAAQWRSGPEQQNPAFKKQSMFFGNPKKDRKVNLHNSSTVNDSFIVIPIIKVKLHEWGFTFLSFIFWGMTICWVIEKWGKHFNDLKYLRSSHVRPTLPWCTWVKNASSLFLTCGQVPITQDLDPQAEVVPSQRTLQGGITACCAKLDG